MSEKTDQLIKDLNEGRITFLQLENCFIRHLKQRGDLDYLAKRVLCGDLMGSGIVSKAFRHVNELVYEVRLATEED